MTSEHFCDRLEATTFAADDGRVCVYESDPSEDDALWLSERLFARLTFVARAYEMHTLPLLGGMEPVRLTQPMCQSALDELSFIADMLNDPLAHGIAQSVANYIAARLARPGWDGSVTVEGD